MPDSDNGVFSSASNLREYARDFSNNGSEQSKVGLANAISEMYVKQGFSPEEKEIVDGILKKLAQDIFISVRKTIANNLKNSEILPHDIALILANDVEEVSVPMLEFSSILTDQDLIQIIKAKKNEVINLAIVKRKSLSAGVTEAIIDETRESAVVIELLKHSNAKIDNSVFDKIVDKFAENEGVALALPKHDRLSQKLLEKLMAKVSEVVKNKLRTLYPSQFEEYRSAINIAIARSWELSILATVSGNITTNEMSHAVLQLRKENKLTPSLLLMSLCIGDIAFFQIALATLTRNNIENIVKNSENLDSLEEIYANSNLPSSLKKATVALYKIVEGINKIGKVKPGLNVQYVNLVLEKVMETTKDQDIPGMDYILSMINRNIIHN